MLKLVKTSFVALWLAAGSVTGPAMAQNATEMAVRLQMLEEQVRQLTGQVQELSFQLNQLRGQQPRQSGAAQPTQPGQPRQLAAASAGGMLPPGEGIETIEQQPLAPAQPGEADVAGAAPGPTVLGELGTSAAQPADGGFQGKVLVPPSHQEAGEELVTPPPAAASADLFSDGEAVETVSLDPAAPGETPESLYERSNESLLRRQYGEAEAGFTTFLQKYPEHSLAGSAQYWLGETFYVQGDFKSAAAHFLRGYKTYPKSRRAPDSLLKLGISLNRLGQGDQACAALAAVNTEYPKAVDARKRAQAESKRAGCGS
ncbi:MAG: tol-pal system protein YbgF [Aestuariivirga sp.]|uniref:tol-pal system protein YbgF n=1 Tax=Aestuariivirga sp. TaxID=2650926 RepID=UPI0038D0746C